ncbi:TSUP family transporter [bacterium]|nr:TSUP family transporter [bacterium]
MLAYANEGVLDLPVAGVVAVGLLVGAIFGARIAIGLPSKTVKRLYGLFLLFVALRFITG